MVCGIRQVFAIAIGKRPTEPRQVRRAGITSARPDMTAIANGVPSKTELAKLMEREYDPARVSLYVA